MKATKGHWPKGKRRHAEPGDWPQILAALRRAGEQQKTAELARKIGVHRNTIFSKWRHSIDMPSPTMQARLRHQLRRMELLDAP